MSGSWTKGRDQFFPCETWSVNYEWYWEIAIWSCEDTLYSSPRAEKVFCIKILLILPKFHEKTLSRSGDIKIFCPGRMYMYSLLHPRLPPFMDEVLSEEEGFRGRSLFQIPGEERQLMKWVGIFLVRIFRGRIF